MKAFSGTFLVCLVLCVVVAFFFMDIMVSNIWVMVVLFALFLAILITAFISLASKIEELERKVQQLLENKQD